MNTDKYEIVPIYISKDKIWYTGHMLFDIDVYKDFEHLKRYAVPCALVAKKDGYYLQRTTGLFRKDITDLDVAFPIVHGNNVEDGTIQGFLHAIGIPFVGSNVLGSALGQDKVVMKQIFGAMDIPIVDYVWFYDTEYAESQDELLDKISELEYPVIVKPATLGSSVGITFVDSPTKINAAIEEAIQYDEKIIVEKAVSNLVEVNCSVLGNYSYQQTSEIEEVLPSSAVLSYQDKYISGSKGTSKGMASTSRIIPARIDQTTEKIVRDNAIAVFRALHLGGVCRIDFLINKETKEVFVNEPNTIPGSLSFYLWEPKGKKYMELLDEMITLAIKEFKARGKKVSSFETNILKGYTMGAKGLKGGKGKLK
jgi:D-alanine-D-alanine ligase